MKKIALLFMLIFTFTISYSSVILGNKGSKKNKITKSDTKTKIVLPFDIDCNAMYSTMFNYSITTAQTGFRLCIE